MACRCRLEKLVRRLGLIQVVFGALSVLLGIFDMYMSWQPYNEELAICGKMNGDGSVYYPCEGWKYSQLIGAIGIPLWAGKYFVAAGSIALRIQVSDSCPEIKLGNKVKLAIFSRLAAAGAVLISPALVTFLITEIVLSPAGRGHIHNGFPVLKWTVPTLAAAVGVILWLLCMVSAFVVCLQNKCSCLSTMNEHQVPKIKITMDKPSKDRLKDADKKQDINETTEQTRKKSSKRRSLSERNKAFRNRGEDADNDAHTYETMELSQRRESNVSDILLSDEGETYPKSKHGRRRKSKSAKKREARSSLPPTSEKDPGTRRWEIRKNSGYALDVEKRRRRQRSSDGKRRWGVETEA